MEEAMYAIGQHCSGAARRNIKLYGSKGPSIARLGRRAGHTPNRFNRLSPLWMRVVKRCFVFGQDHLARQRHTREEVFGTIKKLNAKHPTTLLTVED